MDEGRTKPIVTLGLTIGAEKSKGGWVQITGGWKYIGNQLERVEEYSDT